MRFICLGYADEKAHAISREAQSPVMEESLAYYDELVEAGHVASPGEALQSARTAKTLRWKNGKVIVTDGPYAETKEQLGGFCVVEANDMNHAIELLSKHPIVRFGATFEIRPADEPTNALVAARHQRVDQRKDRF
jgi:hypothetical protein